MSHIWKRHDGVLVEGRSYLGCCYLLGEGKGGWWDVSTTKGGPSCYSVHFTGLKPCPQPTSAGVQAGRADAMSHEWKNGDRALVRYHSHRLDGARVRLSRWSNCYCLWWCDPDSPATPAWLPQSALSPVPDDFKAAPLEPGDPRGPAPLREFYPYWKAGFEQGKAVREPGLPSVATTLEGIGRWQQADPSRRRVSIQLQGHLVQVWATVLDPSVRTHKFDFFTPDTAEQAHDILAKGMVAGEGHPNLEFANTKVNFRFHETTGEIEP